jgi:plastocyanin
MSKNSYALETSAPGPSPRTVGHGRLAIGVVLFGLALGLAACSSGGGVSSATVATQPPASSGGGGASDSITIRNFAFSPATVTVAPGATVTVTNKDSVTHTLSATKGGFGTGDIPPGGSKTFTAPKTPGQYPYICMIHQYMSGTIIVSH